MTVPDNVRTPLDLLQSYVQDLIASHKIVAGPAGVPHAYTAGFNDACGIILDYIAWAKTQEQRPVLHAPSETL